MELKAYLCLEIVPDLHCRVIIPLASSRGGVVGIVVARYIIVVVALATATSLLAQQISSIIFEDRWSSSASNAKLAREVGWPAKWFWP